MPCSLSRPPQPADFGLEVVDLGSELRQLSVETGNPRPAPGGQFRRFALILPEREGHLPPDLVQVGPEAGQHRGSGVIAFPDQAEQHVLGADVVVAELQRLAERKLE